MYKPTKVTLEIRGNMAASLRDMVSGCSPLVLYNCYKTESDKTCEYEELDNTIYGYINDNFAIVIIISTALPCCD